MGEINYEDLWYRFRNWLDMGSKYGDVDGDKDRTEAIHSIIKVMNKMEADAKDVK